MKKTKIQAGFAHPILLLLLIAIASIIGFAGYTVTTTPKDNLLSTAHTNTALTASKSMPTTLTESYALAKCSQFTSTYYQPFRQDLGREPTSAEKKVLKDACQTGYRDGYADAVRVSRGGTRNPICQELYVDDLQAKGQSPATQQNRACTAGYHRGEDYAQARIPKQPVSKPEKPVKPTKPKPYKPHSYNSYTLGIFRQATARWWSGNDFGSHEANSLVYNDQYANHPLNVDSPEVTCKPGNVKIVYYNDPHDGAIAHADIHGATEAFKKANPSRYCKMYFNNAFQYQIADAKYACTTFIHEYGHMIGYAHNQRVSSIMYDGYGLGKGGTRETFDVNKVSTAARSLCAEFF